MSAPVEKTTPEVTNEKPTEAAAPAKKEPGRFDKTFGKLHCCYSMLSIQLDQPLTSNLDCLH